MKTGSKTLIFDEISVGQILLCEIQLDKNSLGEAKRFCLKPIFSRLNSNEQKVYIVYISIYRAQFLTFFGNFDQFWAIIGDLREKLV